MVKKLVIALLLFFVEASSEYLSSKTSFDKTSFDKTGFDKTYFDLYSNFESVDGQIVTDPEILGRAARHALKYYFKNKGFKGLFYVPNLENKDSRTKTESALNFVIKSIEQDRKSGKNDYRILDPMFLKKNFSFKKWNFALPNGKKKEVKVPKWINNGNLPDGKIKLTCYAVFCYRGSYFKTKEHSCGIYEIKNDDFKTKYMGLLEREDILERGILERKAFKKYVKPLAWVSRKDIEDGFVQGSMVVTMPDGKKRRFNVNQINKPKKYNVDFYEREKLTNKKTLYWYFKEIKNVKNMYEGRMIDFFGLGGAVFAGDLKNIGVGKIIAIKYREPATGEIKVLLGVLADAGIAFSVNKSQLDLFAGVFDSRKKFSKYIKNFSDVGEAYILDLKQKAKPTQNQHTKVVKKRLINRSI